MVGKIGGSSSSSMLVYVTPEPAKVSRASLEARYPGAYAKARRLAHLLKYYGPKARVTVEADNDLFAVLHDSPRLPQDHVEAELWCVRAKRDLIALAAIDGVA